MRKIRAGIIGYGKIGKLRHRVFEDLDLGEIVSICDPYADLSDLSDDYLVSNDYREILDSDIEAVFVATTNNVTSEVVIEALSKGIHVFSEKPPGRNLQEVVDIKDQYEVNTDLVLKFGFNHRYHASVLEAYDIYQSGRLGDLMWARGLYGKSGGEGFEDEWRSDKKIAGGGILLDQGIHMIDLLNLFFGGFDEVKSFVTNTYWDIPVEDNAFSLLKNKNNQYALFHSSSTQWNHLFRLELFFEDGYLIIPGFLTSSRSYSPEKLIMARRNFNDDGKPVEEEIYFDEDNSWELEMREFTEAITEKSSIDNGNVYDAVKAMELIHRIYHSDENWIGKMNQTIAE